MYNIFFSVVVNNGCIAQSVERWSNKPLVMGSSPIVTSFFCLALHVRIRGRAVKALRSGRSQLCWRGFESHRMHDFFVTLFRVQRESEIFCHTRARQKHWGKAAKEQKVASEQAQKKMAVPGFEPGSSGSQPLMLTTTLYHQGMVQSDKNPHQDLTLMDAVWPVGVHGRL